MESEEVTEAQARDTGEQDDEVVDSDSTVQEEKLGERSVDMEHWWRND